MKRFYTIIYSVFFCSLLFAQQIKDDRGYIRCYSNQVLDQELKQEPGLKGRMDAIEEQTQKWISEHPNGSGDRAVITIPVVVHVLWRLSNSNISDAQIQSQIDVLNEDYARLNADTINTPSVFQGVAANTQVQFCIAKQDPNGQATTGITRTQVTTQNIGWTNKYYQTSQGGHDIWDRDSYLNFWVCEIGNGILGFSQFPGANASKDGVVIDYRYFGTIGTATSPFDLGRTATHEVGHWVNLRHIWGDSNCGNDNVSDTPTQQAANYYCPSFPHVTCGNGPNGDMFQNYMDYTDDDCMNIFTQGQAARIAATLNGTRSSLQSSIGCDYPSSISKLRKANNINLYPNPSSGNLTISFSGNRPNEAEISIRNILGELIYNVIYTVDTKRTIRLDLNNYQDGLYFITIKTESGSELKKIQLKH